MVQRVRARLRHGPPPDPLPDVYTKCFCSSFVAATAWPGSDLSPAGRCSRADVNARVKATCESAARVSTPRRRRGYVRGRVFVGFRGTCAQKNTRNTPCHGFCSHRAFCSQSSKTSKINQTSASQKSKMTSYSTMNTIPAADVSETPLLSRDISKFTTQYNRERDASTGQEAHTS